jgi:hypothetical protein
VLRDRDDSGVLDGNFVQMFESVDHAKCFAIFLCDAKPSRTIRGVGWLVDACCGLLLKHFTDIVVDAWLDRNITLNPRHVQNDGEFDWREELWSEATTFTFGPRETCIMVSDEVMHEISLFRPEKVSGMISVNYVFALQSIAQCRNKCRRQMRIELQHVFERIACNVADNAKAIREVSDDRMNFEHDRLVLLL